jgi:nucleoid-associated protein YgaU
MATTLNLRSNNPYSIGYISDLGDGNLSLDRDNLKLSKNSLDKYHTIKDGDDLTLLAYQFYGDSKLWWIIADANNLHNPLDLTEGLYLVIPDYYLAITAIP